MKRTESRTMAVSGQGPSEMYKVPLVLTPQPEGGYTVSCPVLPELVTEGETVQEALANVPDALLATVELYQDLSRPLPSSVVQHPQSEPVWFDALVAVP